MATQHGITVAAANESFKVVSDIARPKPGHKQVLVKSLATSINPVDPWMQHTGMLVASWPVVLGCDASGVVLEAGPGCTKLKAGDHVFGCTRVGQTQYSSFQETHLMDEDLAFKRPSGWSAEDASTVGVGIETAALGLIAGGKLALPAPGTQAPAKDEWVIVLGASGTVGQFGVQIAALAGYSVLASCSASKASIPSGHGAAATLNNRLSVDEQLAEIKKVTGGKFSVVFDASAYAAELGIKALDTVSTESNRLFSTVDDFSELQIPATTDSYRVRLGAMGHDAEGNPKGPEVTAAVKDIMPALEGNVAHGAFKPLEYELVDGVGWESVLKAIELQESGKAAKKIVVHIQKE